MPGVSAWCPCPQPGKHDLGISLPIKIVWCVWVKQDWMLIQNVTELYNILEMTWMNIAAADLTMHFENSFNIICIEILIISIVTKQLYRNLYVDLDPFWAMGYSSTKNLPKTTWKKPDSKTSPSSFPRKWNYKSLLFLYTIKSNSAKKAERMLVWVYHK